jgi:hypothetical protein
MRLWKPLVLLALCWATTDAQETTRQVDGSGTFTKYLTPGLQDSWVINGAKGETIIAHVSTKEYDPILKLATSPDGQDQILIEVDDEGSEARFSMRLPQDGEYRIQIHAFKYKGGGNYSLRLRRFQPSPLVLGEPVIGTIDKNGKSHHYFQGKKNQIVVPDLKGTAARAWEMIDHKGRTMERWAGSVKIENDGVHSFVVSGDTGNRYQLLVRTAAQKKLEDQKVLKGSLGQNEMDVWGFDGKAGDFRLLEVDVQGQVRSRLIFSPTEKKNAQRISREDNRPEIQFKSVGSKGGLQRFAAVLGRTGRYELQLIAETPVTYTLKMTDPARLITDKKPVAGQLAVGGSTFYFFKASPGQLFQASLASGQFDPLMRLYNSRGDLIQQNDDGDGGIGSRITHLVMKKDLYRIQVSSLGNGGGGEYKLRLNELKLKTLKTGDRAAGTLNSNSSDFWSFSGEEGKTVLLSVSSTVCDPFVRLFNPDGVNVGSDDNNGVGANSLLAVRLPKTGRYTVSIKTQRGAGAYQLRLIDGD